MALKWYSVVVDSHDPQKLAHWWAAALDWQVVYDTPEEAVAIPKDLDDEIALESFDGWRAVGPGLVFVPVPETKSIKNRLHIDLAPHTSQDRDAEIERLIAMGAARADVGQTGDVTWTVLADPEGNEFCVLSTRNQ